ncbi:hypothetical protein Aab01nite_47660 [Paractinoplanes abujensis]|uniref:Aspartate/methionine/tyrosine aminotransferase n=1 Tax=Paractinoplanes abujensis TaxID=882441 RepID=A0A7W7FZD5_9ACTN|nr:pyridoxal phosphate-dependent aminotransferase [Actinoplanes abujensis]MBB4690412.1 aspartate/methionine/tyrosine aminotransferase [Actinoplanes abujensis]GID21176.1 hypothetical protein Aab01nite_47660 [Actinoplanes abujensis]
MTARNLTELELRALDPRVINLSDGHAHQTLSAESQAGIRTAVERALAGTRPDYPEAERQFLRALTHHTGQEYPDGRTFVTYASSVAMSAVASHLRRMDRPVGVVCPTFDNIPGLLRTLDIKPIPIDERDLTPTVDLARLDLNGLGALVLVAPNNPTGRCPTRASLEELIGWAAARDVLLVVDTAFRWCDDTMRWDLVRAAEEQGADLITIDDTGKALAFADVKAAVIGVTRRLSEPIRAIHTQYLLNVSELGLRALTVMLDPSRPDNELERARKIILKNRAYFDNAIEAQVGSIGQDPRRRDRNPALSVEWLRLPTGRDTLLEECRARQLEVLNGDQFFWAGESLETGTFVRLALMRDPAYFARGIDLFVESLSRTRNVHRRLPLRNRRD